MYNDQCSYFISISYPVLFQGDKSNKYMLIYTFHDQKIILLCIKCSQAVLHRGVYMSRV